jgi:hypothetical protein
MTEYVAETYEEVRELLQTVSWEIMDEEQRDDVMRKVVVPRWGATTADGVELKGTAWARMLGTTEPTVRKRVVRIRAADQGKPAQADEPTESQKSQIRGAKAALRQHPELAKQLLGDPDVTDAVEQAVASDPAATARVNQKAAEQRPAPRQPAPERSSMSAAASAAALEAAAAQLRRATDEVVADVMDGQLNPGLLAEPLASIEADAKRLRIACENPTNIDQALADLLEGEGQ